MSRTIVPTASDFPAARAAFERAHALRPTARTFRGIGVSAFREGDYVAAARAQYQRMFSLCNAGNNRGALDAAAFEAEEARGRALAYDEVMRQARDWLAQERPRRR